MEVSSNQYYIGFNISIYEPRFIWEAIELALASSTGILLSFAWVQYTNSIGRDINIIEQLIIAFVATFLAGVIFKFMLNFLRSNYDKFLICS